MLELTSHLRAEQGRLLPSHLVLSSSLEGSSSDALELISEC